MSNIAEVIRHFPSDLQDPMLQFWEVMKDEIGVKREDFSELKSIVLELAEAQNRTEHRVEELAQSQNRTEQRVEELALAQKELAQSQNRTEQRVEELALAQKELAQSQNRTEQRVEELALAQKELTQSQNRTEQRVEELALAQRDTEQSLQRLSATIEFKVGGIGRRWGIGSESSFRRGLVEILSDTGYEVFNYIESDKKGIVFGHPAVIEIDVIIKGDKTIVVEIKSSVSTSDVYVFMKKAHFYEHLSGKQIDRFLMITPYIEDSARVIANEYQILICDSISDLGSTIQRV